MEWTNLNKILNELADEQGIEAGSSLWVSAGPAAYSGQTGGHGSYGWSHACKLSPEWVRAVIANYAHRRCYYLKAPLRSGNYLSGGRPIGWKPEMPGDLESGEWACITSKGILNISGPDVQHFQMNPLFTVADSTGYTVKAQGKTWKAELIAGLLIRMLMTTMAGQVRAGKSYLWGDRGAAIIVHNAARAAKRDLIDGEDAKAIMEWFSKNCLPFYRKAPGHQINTKDNGLPAPNFQAYNGIFYLMPAFRSALDVLQGEEYAGTKECLLTWSRWLVDLDRIVPESCLDVSAFAATAELQAGVNGKPCPTLDGKLTPEQVLTGSKWPSQWAFCSAMIAEEQLGEIARPLADKMRAKWIPQATKNDVRVYIVDPVGNYV